VAPSPGRPVDRTGDRPSDLLGDRLGDLLDQRRADRAADRAADPERAADLRGERGDERPTGSTVRNLILGAQMRKLREQARVTRLEAGEVIRCSPSKLSRMENGRVRLKERDVGDLLTCYGVTEPEQRERYLDMARRSRQPDWWSAHSSLVPTWFGEYLGLEEAAQRIQTYEVQFVPGLLQCEEYMRAVASGRRNPYRLADIDNWVSLRKRRQEILYAASPPKYWAVVNESALRRPAGGRKVMQAQFDRLLEISALPQVSLQVLEGEAAGAAVETAFTLLRFAGPELEDIVYVEHLTGALYLERPEDVEAYSRAMDRLAVEARTPAESRKVLARMRAEL
jgi:transcriptional regulator with XRE-family HTH domain